MLFKKFKALSTLSQKSATVAEFALFCDSLTFLQQSHFSSTVCTGLKTLSFQIESGWNLAGLRPFRVRVDGRGLGLNSLLNFQTSCLLHLQPPRSQLSPPRLLFLGTNACSFFAIKCIKPCIFTWKLKNSLHDLTPNGRPTPQPLDPLLFSVKSHSGMIDLEVNIACLTKLHFIHDWRDRIFDLSLSIQRP